MNKKETKNTPAELTINQDITIINTGVLKAKIEDALSSSSALDLILKDVEFIDLAGIQLLYALKKAAIKEDKKLVINFDMKADFVKNIRLAGYSDLLEN
jgi:anti-anti-sigma regulatory factor